MKENLSKIPEGRLIKATKLYLIQVPHFTPYLNVFLANYGLLDDLHPYLAFDSRGCLGPRMELTRYSES